MENNTCTKCGKFISEVGDWCWVCYLKNGQELQEENKKNERNEKRN